MDDASPLPRQRPAPDHVWARVREDYLAGVPARECCRRHGVGRSALFERAAEEKWRRIDQPWVAPDALDPDDEGLALDARIDGDISLLAPEDLAEVAVSRLMRAALRGDALGALRWGRVRQALDDEGQRLARIESGRRRTAQLQAQMEARAAVRTAPDSPDGPDSFAPRPDSPP
ncbi:MAG: hypothetical protein REJ23_02260 [Brevundimonas sp.]|nr:hypothetical protein [Brevundimonas sp.]